MGIHHDVVLGGFYHGTVIVGDERLAVVMLPERDNVAHITALHGVIAVLVHKGIGLFHPALVINGG